MFLSFCHIEQILIISQVIANKINIKKGLILFHELNI